jgi:ABC-type polysaccharide/polyol phosphate export permease
MPEDLPNAVMVLLWLLIGVIILGYLIMELPIIVSVIFALLFYGLPVWWNAKKGEGRESQT